MKDKIYRRPTQLGATPKKKRNEKNRIRNTIINFRVTPMEKELIDARISLSGLSRSSFFIESCLYQTILVKGNIRTFSEIRNRLAEIAEAIQRNPDPAELTPAQQEALKTIFEIIDRRFGKEKTDGNKDLR